MHGSCHKKTNDHGYNENCNELGATLNLQGTNEHVEECGELRKRCAQKKSE
jgi:hypothetical protein